MLADRRGVNASVTALVQCRHAAREAEIFRRLTTSVVCRGIEGESLQHVILRIYFCDDRTGCTRDPSLSLSAHFLSVQVP